KLIDASEIMSEMEPGSDVSQPATAAVSDSTEAKVTVPVEDTTSLSLIVVPRNIDFDLNASLNEFKYDNIDARNIKGKIVIHDGVLSLKNTDMELLGGTLAMNADYDTRDTLKPVMKADFNLKGVGIKDAFNTFNTVRKLAPAAKGLDGKINAKLDYNSLLGKDMMPLVSTINGYGKIQSDQITLVESATFDRMKELLKLGDKYGNTFKDINISFRITDGRIYVSPFDVKTGNLKMNISGDQGLDQTINYIVKTQFPRSDLGGAVNSFLDNLSDQAARFGIAYKPADVLKVNVKVTGTFSKPVVSPFFGSDGSSSAGSGGEKPAAKQVIDNTIDNAKEKARAEAEARGDKLIKEAEERGQQLKDEAARAAEKLRSEAASQAKKLNEDASSKGPLAKMAAKKAADGLIKTADQKADQLIREADSQAAKLVDEAKTKKEDLLKKI
ncbi:MAG TPA: AsmA-like C-terminal region-containing protein, partial [Bacteroidales bacterium]|nr:AsmA-like C-terminal region-containing protein [Bacteroidales bacterium]